MVRSRLHARHKKLEKNKPLQTLYTVESMSRSPPLAQATSWLDMCFRDNQSSAYVFESYARAHLVSPRARLAAKLVPRGAGQLDAAPLIAAATAPPPGLSWNAYGVAFDRTKWDFSSPFHGAVLDPLLIMDSYDLPIVLHDHLARVQVSHKSSNSKLQRMARELERDGFARIDITWGLAPMLMTEGVQTNLSQRLAVLARAGGHHSGLLHPDEEAFASTADIRGVPTALVNHVEPLLTELAIMYLGKDAELASYSGSSVKALRIPRRPPERWGELYPSGYYHHDRCGRRLKAVLFLSNVTEDSHPTRIAVGSHKSLWWTHADQSVSSFADAYVERNYDVRPMLGQVGEGFVFDTNSIHRATMLGNGSSRETLVMEFNQREKAAALTRSPCGACEHGTCSQRQRHGAHPSHNGLVRTNHS